MDFLVKLNLLYLKQPHLKLEPLALRSKFVIQRREAIPHQILNGSEGLITLFALRLTKIKFLFRFVLNYPDWFRVFSNVCFVLSYELLD